MSQNLGGDLERETLLEIDERLRELTKKIRRLPRNWKRLVELGVSGAAVGALTGGLAAPAVGGTIGASMGLSGAAATNAGLALLGGGSLASGGLGMAGGTALIATAGGVAGGGIFAAGSAFADSSISVAQKAPDPRSESRSITIPGTADEAAIDGAKLCVLTEYVVIGAQEDTQKAKQLRSDLVSVRVGVGDQLERLGWGDPTSANTDQLTQISVVLAKTVDALTEIIEEG